MVKAIIYKNGELLEIKNFDSTEEAYNYLSKCFESIMLYWFKTKDGEVWKFDDGIYTEIIFGEEL